MNTKSPGDVVKIFYTNADSIVNKINLLKAHVLESSPDLIAITESWTHKDILKSDLNIPGYELVDRCDRTDTKLGRGGGVLLYSNLSNVTVNEEFKTTFHQHIAVKMSNKGEPDLHIHVVYRSPNSTYESNDALLGYMENLPENVVLIGDFNLPEIDWTSGHQLWGRQL